MARTRDRRRAFQARKALRRVVLSAVVLAMGGAAEPARGGLVGCARESGESVPAPTCRAACGESAGDNGAVKAGERGGKTSASRRMTRRWAGAGASGSAEDHDGSLAGGGQRCG